MVVTIVAPNWRTRSYTLTQMHRGTHEQTDRSSHSQAPAYCHAFRRVQSASQERDKKIESERGQDEFIHIEVGKTAVLQLLPLAAPLPPASRLSRDRRCSRGDGRRGVRSEMTLTSCYISPPCSAYSRRATTSILTTERIGEG